MKTTKDTKSNPLDRWSQQYDHRKQEFAGWLGERFNRLARKGQIVLFVSCFLCATGLCTSMIFGGFQQKNIPKTERMVLPKLPNEEVKERKKRDSLQQSKPIYQYKNNEHGKDGNNPKD